MPIESWQAALAIVVVGLLFGVGFHIAALLVSATYARMQRTHERSER